MLKRRHLIALVALATVGTVSQAQEWKSKYPELVFAVIPAENAALTTER
jgi:phosphonate transport system substrate-binding protein